MIKLKITLFRLLLILLFTQLVAAQDDTVQHVSSYVPDGCISLIGYSDFEALRKNYANRPAIIDHYTRELSRLPLVGDHENVRWLLTFTRLELQPRFAKNPADPATDNRKKKKHLLYLHRTAARLVALNYPADIEKKLSEQINEPVKRHLGVGIYKVTVENDPRRGNAFVALIEADKLIISDTIEEAQSIISSSRGLLPSRIDDPKFRSILNQVESNDRWYIYPRDILFDPDTDCGYEDDMKTPPPFSGIEYEIQEVYFKEDVEVKNTMVFTSEESYKDWKFSQANSRVQYSEDTPAYMIKTIQRMLDMDSVKTDGLIRVERKTMLLDEFELIQETRQRLKELKSKKGKD